MKILFCLSFFLISVNVCRAQSIAEKEITLAVEQLRINLIKPDQEKLEKIIADSLSYGHSSGLIENKREFIKSLITGKFHLTSLEITSQVIQVIGGIAIVRHHFSGNAHDAGKAPSIVNLGILQVWEKNKGKWILLARQAFPQLN